MHVVATHRQILSRAALRTVLQVADHTCVPGQSCSQMSKERRRHEVGGRALASLGMPRKTCE